MVKKIDSYFYPSYCVLFEAGYSPVEVAVFGYVWYRNQGKYNACIAAKATIAESLNVSESTVTRCLHKLTKSGLLIDETPRRRNRPHRYVITQKIEKIAEISEEVDYVQMTPEEMEAKMNKTGLQRASEIDWANA